MGGAREMGTAYSNLAGWKRQLGRHRHRWVDNIKTYLKEIIPDRGRGFFF
jgi:hypothetical protein